MEKYLPPKADPPNGGKLRAIIAQGLIFAFLLNSFGPPPSAQAQDFVLSAPGSMVPLSPAFNPPILKGIKVHPDNPFRFDFILDQGDSPSLVKEGVRGSLKQESTKLIKYFLASLTIPEKDLWVNLSPYEKNRIVPESFGETEMGRDLLAEDYMLKQITASLIYPEGEVGKKFWKRIYEEAAKKFGTTNIPVNTFNKVWIVPEKAVVYENAKAGTAYVVEAKLKVMLEQDYLALNKNMSLRGGLRQESLPTKQSLSTVIPERFNRESSTLGSQIVREIVIPELTKEVNYGQNFSQLRQVYNSLILATWYKKKIKDSILSQIYADKNKIAGINYRAKGSGIRDKQGKLIPYPLSLSPSDIYNQYLQAFKKGAYNYIKEEVDPISQQSVPRKYFSGGVSIYQVGKIEKYISQLPPEDMVNNDGAMMIETQLNQAMMNQKHDAAVKVDLVGTLRPELRILIEQKPEEPKLPKLSMADLMRLDKPAIVLYGSRHSPPVQAGQLYSLFRDYDDLHDKEKEHFRALLQTYQENIMEDSDSRKNIQIINQFLHTQSLIPKVVAFEGSPEELKRKLSNLNKIHQNVEKALQEFGIFEDKLIDAIMLYIFGPAIYLKFRGDAQAQAMQLVGVEDDNLRNIGAIFVFSTTLMHGQIAKYISDKKLPSEFNNYISMISNLPFKLHRDLTENEISGFVQPLKDEQLQRMFTSYLRDMMVISTNSINRDQSIVENINREHPNKRVLLLVGAGHILNLSELLTNYPAAYILVDQDASMTTVLENYKMRLREILKDHPDSLKILDSIHDPLELYYFSRFEEGKDPKAMSPIIQGLSEYLDRLNIIAKEINPLEPDEEFWQLIRSNKSNPMGNAAMTGVGGKADGAMNAEKQDKAMLLSNRTVKVLGHDQAMNSIQDKQRLLQEVYQPDHLAKTLRQLYSKIDRKKAEALSTEVVQEGFHYETDQEGWVVFVTSQGHALAKISALGTCRFFDENGKWLMTVDPFGHVMESFQYNPRGELIHVQGILPSGRQFHLKNGNFIAGRDRQLVHGTVLTVGNLGKVIFKIHKQLESLFNSPQQVPTASGAEFIPAYAKGAGTIVLNLLSRVLKDHNMQGVQSEQKLVYTGNFALPYIFYSLNEVGHINFRGTPDEFLRDSSVFQWEPAPFERIINDKFEIYVHNRGGKIIRAGIKIDGEWQQYFLSSDLDEGIVVMSEHRTQSGRERFTPTMPDHRIFPLSKNVFLLQDKQWDNSYTTHSAIDGLGNIVDLAMQTQKKFKNTKGGIDLTSDKALSVQNSGQGIKFHLDPAQLEQLQNALGFVPVIINIQPLKSLSEFLGLNQPQASTQLASAA